MFCDLVLGVSELNLSFATIKYNFIPYNTLFLFVCLDSTICVKSNC